MPSSVGATRRTSDLRRPRRPQPAQHRNIRMTADRVALIDWDEAHVDVPDLDLAHPTTPPVSTATRMTSPRKHRPHGKLPFAGTRSTQSSDSPKFERSEQRRRIERPLVFDCRQISMDFRLSAQAAEQVFAQCSGGWRVTQNKSANTYVIEFAV